MKKNNQKIAVLIVIALSVVVLIVTLIRENFRCYEVLNHKKMPTTGIDIDEEAGDCIFIEAMLMNDARELMNEIYTRADKLACKRNKCDKKIFTNINFFRTTDDLLNTTKLCVLYKIISRDFDYCPYYEGMILTADMLCKDFYYPLLEQEKKLN